MSRGSMIAMTRMTIFFQLYYTAIATGGGISSIMMEPAIKEKNLAITAVIIVIPIYHVETSRYIVPSWELEKI